jgi:hypothetical protein
MNLRGLALALLLTPALLAAADAPPAKKAARPGPAGGGVRRPDSYPPMERPAPKYRWEHVAGESLALVGPWGLVWRLNFGPGLTKPHFDPLQTADGRSLTWVSPEDHPWHYGLWHSWKLIDGVNYWEVDRKTRRADGTTRLVEAKVERLDVKAGARVVLRLAYHPAAQPDATVMEDTITLDMRLPREDGSYLIEWEQVSRARRSVVLDRTPPPGQPDGKGFGGYAGLSLRGSRFLTDVVITNSEGRTNAAAHRQPARWAALAGRIDGRPAGFALFDHPANPRYPTPWFFVWQAPTAKRPPAPFWYLNAALLCDRPLTLTPDQPLVLRYRMRVDSQSPSADELEAEARQFAATASRQRPSPP